MDCELQGYGERPRAYEGGGIGKPGTGTLSVDGNKVASGRIEKTQPLRFSLDESFDVGMDTGTLNKLTFDLQPQQMMPEEHAAQAEKGQRNNAASQ